MMILPQTFSILNVFGLIIFTILPLALTERPEKDWAPMHHAAPNPCQVGLSSFNMQICFFITRKSEF